MNRSTTLALGTIILFYAGVASSAGAQTLAEKVVGTWTLEAGSENYPDGRKLQSWATGNLIFDPTGHFSQFLIGKERPKTSTSVRTPVGPGVAFYGMYTVDEATGTLTLKVESGVTPVFDGTTRQVKASIKGDILTATSPETVTPEGPMIPVNEWKRVK